MRLGVRLNVVVILGLACALATTAGIAGADTPSAGLGAEATAKKKCGKGKTRVKRKGRSSVCATKCKAGFKRTVSKRGKVGCARRKRKGATKPGAPGSGGPKSGNYSGTTAQNRTMTFTVAGGQVTNFQAGVNTYCSTPGNSRFVIDAIANIPPMALGPDGSFSYKGTSDQGNPEISGKITGGSATGNVGMSRGDSNYDFREGLKFGSCSGTAAWNAAG